MSPCTATTEAHSLSPCPATREATRMRSPCTTTRESRAAMKTQHRQKLIIFKSNYQNTLTYTMMMHIVYPELFLYLTLFNPNGKPALTLFIYINILTYGASLVAQMQGRRPRFNPCVRKVLWRRKWQPTPVFLPGKSQEQRCLVGYVVQGAAKGLDTTWRLNNHSAHLDKWIMMFLRRSRVNIQSKKILKSFTEKKNGILFWLEA